LRRAKYPLSEEEVLSDMRTGMLFADEDGFLVLGGKHRCLHVVHCYVRPGNTVLFDKFEKITDETARYFGCKAILFTTMRPKGLGRILGPRGYKPAGAVIFRKEVKP
jgi:hypothetical protein